MIIDEITELEKLEKATQESYETPTSVESGVLPFESIITTFQDRLVEYIEEEKDTKPKIIKTATDSNSGEVFLDLDLEELFNIPVDDGSSEVAVLLLSNAVG